MSKSWLDILLTLLVMRILHSVSERKKLIGEKMMKMSLAKNGERMKELYTPLMVVNSSTIGAVTWACNCHVQPAATPRLNWAVKTGSTAEAGHQLSVNYMARWQHHHHERAPASLFSATAALSHLKASSPNTGIIWSQIIAQRASGKLICKQKEKLLCLYLFIHHTWHCLCSFPQENWHFELWMYQIDIHFLQSFFWLWAKSRIWYWTWNCVF